MRSEEVGFNTISKRMGSIAPNRVARGLLYYSRHTISTYNLFSTNNIVIFADIVDITSSFDKVTFKYCPREANKVAHELAKFSFLNNQSCNWVDEPPSFLLNSIINDVTIL
jgi:hypothetical protein